MTTQTTTPNAMDAMNAGQRLHCEKCGSEVEIIQPCTCSPSDMSLRCCGQDMRPTVGQDVHVSAE
jgi:hypothetical protein